LCFFIFGLTHPVLAKTNPVDINTLHLDAPVPIDKAIRKGTLSNGLSYYIKKNTKPEKRMELRLVIKAGAINEDADQNGIAHFVEHMLFNGTTHFPKNKLIHDLEKIGVRFGADLNAYTSDDHTVYQLPIATDKPELINLGFQIVADWAGRAIFDPQEIDRERGVVLEEWRSNQGAGMRADKVHRQFFYYGSKLARHDVIGEARVIQKAPYPVISRFYQDWYRPDLIAVIAVGDFNVADIEKLIKAQFSYLKMPEKSRQLTGNAIEIQPNKTPLISIYTDNEQTATTATILYKKPAENQNTVRHLRNTFIHSMISIMMNERIEALLQKTDSPLQMAGINYGLFFRHTDVASLYIVPKTTDFMQGYKAFLTEVFRAAQSGFTQGEYNRAKANLLSRLEAEYHNRDKTNSEQFAEEYIRSFINNESLPGIENEYHYSESLAKTIPIETINQSLKNYFTEDNRVMAISAVKKAGVDLPTKEQLLVTYQTLKNSQYSAFKDEFTDKVLFAKKITAGSIVKTKEIKPI
jgi:zinc protease